MKYLFDKNITKGIERLNQISGLNHRTKPYDINNREDLKDMLKIKVCALLDYIEYNRRLANLLELIDESIEYFDTSTWLSFTSDKYDSDKLLMKCYDSTRKACDNFDKLVDRTEKEVQEVLSILINSKEDTQIYILGFSLSNIKDINERLNVAVEQAHEIEYEYNMEKAFEKFKEFLKKCLSEKNE